MKNFDVKKLIILIITILIIMGGIFLVNIMTKKAADDKNKLENYIYNIKNYYMFLTEGQNTPYNGIEILYASDETKLQDLDNKLLISIATKYLSQKNTTSNIDYKTLNDIYSNKYPEIKNGVIYNGEDVREALKVLFDIQNHANRSYPSDITNPNGYTYIPEEDVYVEYFDKVESQINTNQFINFKVIDTKEKDDKIVSTITIAYAYVSGDKTKFASDRFGENIVAEITTENVKYFPEDKIDKFDKFEITLKKSSDGKRYVFESVKKVK